MLFCWWPKSPNKWKEYRPEFTYVWDNTKRANSEWAWDEDSRSVMAVEADSGAAAVEEGNARWPR